MKKIICLVLAIIAMLSVVACDGSSKGNGLSGFGGDVSSNGGYAVTKGDYTYFVNGIESNTAANNYGDPLKGALLRVKTADIGANDAKTEVVIPKLVHTSAYANGSGFYIFGDWVYYTSPCDDKDKTGAVMNSSLEYLRTKLDGTKTEVIVTLSALNDVYRYVQIGGKVYLVTYTVVDSVNTITVYGEDGKEVKKAEGVTNYIFSDDVASEYCYYVKLAHDDTLDQDESFSEIHRFKLDGSEDEVILSGGGIGTQGVTYTLIKNTNDALYYSEKYVDTSVNTITTYYGVKLDKIGESLKDNAEVKVLDKGTSRAATVFGANSYYKDLNSIVYYTSDAGFVNYNYENASDPKTLGHSYVMNQKNVISSLSSLTFAFYEGSVAYFTNSDGCYFAIDVDQVLAGNAKLEQLTYTAIHTVSTWFRPEFIGEYILGAVDATPYGGYLYAVKKNSIDVNGAKDADGKTAADRIEAAKEAYDVTVKANIESFVKTRIGKITDADKETYDKYLTDNFDEEE